MISTETQPDQTVSPGMHRQFLSRKLKALLGLLIVFVVFAAFAGRLLVSDHPQKSDIIVVLAGDSQDARY
ncbi:MAG TPA: hypothetical protein VHA06_12815, partial [Candidatus Angelobacter sp.]|nr:hypothetical protein [Candidatus Angelobacter sp.]